MYAILADLVMLLHFAFIAFVAFGALIGLRRPRVLWLHFPALAWGVLAMGLNLACPLTPLEKNLRALGGEGNYAGDFIAHYLGRLIYSGTDARGLQLTLAVLAVIGNAAVYAWVFHRKHARHYLKTKPHGPP